MSASKYEIQRKIDEYAQRLQQLNNDPTADAIEGDEASNPKRVKKRILQKLGKLKKDLLAAVEDDADQLVPSKKPKLFDSNRCILEAVHQEAADTGGVSKKELKAKLRIINQELASFAQKKQLRAAQKRFDWALRKGIPLDVHSYTNLLNAYVRCNDMDGAEKLMQYMRSKQPPLKLNIVTYTTLLKGYCEVGDLESARHLLFAELLASNDESLQPTTRTLNAFLRGCTRIGAVASALAAYQCHTKCGFAVDSTSGDYLIGLLCRSGWLSCALQYIHVTKEHDDDSKLSRASQAVSLSTVAALSGGMELAQQWLVVAEAQLRASAGAQLHQNMASRFSDNSVDEDSYGNRRKTAATDSVNTRGSKSVELFHEHQRSELDVLISLLHDFIAIHCNSSSSTEVSQAMNKQIIRQLSCRRGYIRALSQVLCFGFDGRGDYDNISQRLCSTLVDESCEKGFNNLLRKHWSRQPTESNSPLITARLVFSLRDKFGLRTPRIEELRVGCDAESKEFEVVRQLLKQETSSSVQKILRCVDESTGLINFKELFNGYNELPIKMEICSGGGEWVAAQAAADWHQVQNTNTRQSQLLPKALWVAAELRCDRAHGILTQHLLSNPLRLMPYHSEINTAVENNNAINNLAIIVGDAATVIRNHIAPCSVSAVFINHPQPPERVTGAGDSNQGKHLLTRDFFCGLHRILCPSTGRVTILTDNLSYALSLAEDVATMSRSSESGGFACAAKVDSDGNYEDFQLQQGYPISEEQKQHVRVWRGLPGPMQGHTVPASSYFDRMWQKGQKRRRWFLYLQPLPQVTEKVTTSMVLN